MSDLNNTPGVEEKLAADAPAIKHHKRGCHSTSRGIVREWWWLRLSAGALVPLSVWFITSLVQNLLGADPIALQVWLSHWAAALAMVMLLGFGFVHARLGMHEIIVDYVHCKTKKKLLNALVDLSALVLGVASIAATLTLFMAK